MVGLVITASATRASVELGGNRVGDVRQLLELLVEVLGGSLGGVLFEPVLGLLDSVLDGLLVLVLNLATKTLLVVDLVLQAVGVVLKLVAGLNALTVSLVLLGVLLGLLNHALNVLSAETALVVGDGDALSLSGALVDSGDLEDTVGIELEGDLDLGNATGSRAVVMLACVKCLELQGLTYGMLVSSNFPRLLLRIELVENSAKTFVESRRLMAMKEIPVFGLNKNKYLLIACHGTFTLKDLDQDYGLVVGRRREDLALLGGNAGTALDEGGHDTTGGLNTESERVDIHEDDLLSSLVAGENTTLNSSAESDSLIGVDVLASLLSEELLKHGLNLGDTGRTTNKNNVVNVGLLHLGVLEDLLNGLEGLLEEIVVELLELGAGEGLGEILALVEGLDFDLGGLLGRERTLGLLDLALQLTHSLCVLGDINVVLLVVLLDEVADDTVVEIFTSQVSVTSGGQNLENTLLDGEDGHIECTTTKIVDEDLALGLVGDLVKTVSQSGRGGLVDDTENVKTGDSASVLGGGTLSVVEVGGDGDDGVLDGLTEIALSDLLHLSKNHSRDLLRCESGLFLVDLDADVGLAILVDDLEGEVLDIVLNGLVGELLSNETFLP
jgi:hypothetical protein